MKTARDTGMATSKLVRDVADLLALGYLRYRQRVAGDAAVGARVETVVGTVRKALDDVPHRAPLGTGDPQQTETGARP